jgi:hypothetical protein
VPERHRLRALARVAADDVGNAEVLHAAPSKNRAIASSTSGCSVEYR